MQKWLPGMVAVLAFITSPGHAASLALGCSGTLTTTELPKAGLASDPQKETIVDLSVVIDLDRRAVSGFWTEMNGVHNVIPITAVDANSITFKGTRKFISPNDS